MSHAAEARKIDLKEVKTDYSKPAENPLEGMSQEAIQELLHYRSEMLMELSVHYKALIEAIYKLPFHVVFRNHAFMNFDQGMHWCKAAVDNVWDMPPVEGDVTKVEASEACEHGHVHTEVCEPVCEHVCVDAPASVEPEATCETL